MVANTNRRTAGLAVVALLARSSAALAQVPAVVAEPTEAAPPAPPADEEVQPSPAPPVASTPPTPTAVPVVPAASSEAPPPARRATTRTTGRKPDGPGAVEFEVKDLDVLSLEALLDIKVVTGSKGAESAKDSPSIVTVFTRRQIEDLGALQLIDLLQHVPGFYEVSAQYGRNVAVRGIHGATAQHVVVLKDGVSISEFLTSTAPLDVPLDDVERVEVVRGPGSALYGGNALMSVINLITRSADIDGRTRAQLSFGTDSYYRAAVQSAAPFRDAGGRTRGLVLTGSVWGFGGTRVKARGDESILFPARGVNNSDGLVDGETYTLPRASTGLRVNRQDLSVHVSARYDASDSLVLRASFDKISEGMQRSYRQMLIGSSNRDVSDSYESTRLHVDFEKSWGSAAQYGRLVLHPVVTAVRQRLGSQRLPKDVYADAAREEQSVLFGFAGDDLRTGSVLDYYLDLPAFSVFRENALLVGGQMEYGVAAGYGLNRCFVDSDNAQAPSRFDLPGGSDLYCVDTVMLNEGTTLSMTEFRDSDQSHNGDGDQYALAGYSQLTSSLINGLHLVLGGRIDYKDHAQGQPASAARFSPRLAAVQPLPGKFYVKTQFANAFVNPAFLYRTSNSVSDYEGNPQIHEQSITNVEALLGYAGSRYFEPEISGYYYRVEDFITFDLEKNARTGRYRFDNQGSVEVLGAEGALGASSKDGVLSARINGSFLKPLPNTSPQFLVDGQLGGPTKFPKFVGDLVVKAQPFDWLTLVGTVNYNSKVRHEIAREARFADIVGVDGRAYSSRDADSYTTGGVAIVGANVIWSYHGLQVSAQAKNLFNVAYHRPGSVLVPYYAEGRRLLMTVGYRY